MTPAPAAKWRKYRGSDVYIGIFPCSTLPHQSAAAMASSVRIHWFRKGLRLHDNPALRAAFDSGGSRVLPCFVIDPHFVKSGRVGVLRWNFLLEALRDLDRSLRARNQRRTSRPCMR